MRDEANNARLGSPRFSPWPAGRPGLFPLRPCGRLVGTGLQAIGSLVGTLPGVPFCGSSVGNPEGLFLLSSGYSSACMSRVSLASRSQSPPSSIVRRTTRNEQTGDYIVADPPSTFRSQPTTKGPFDFLQYLLCVWILFSMCVLLRKFRSFHVLTQPQ
jgi:hypothetical protein